MIGIEDKTTRLNEYFESLGNNVSVDPDDPKIVKYYTNIDDEIHAICKGVGVRNISHEGVIELRGNDVIDFLHRITTNSLKNIAKGCVLDTIFTSDKGRIIDVASILNFEDHQLLLCSGHNKSKVMSWIDKYIIADDVEISDSAGKYVMLQVMGPQADSFMTLLIGSVVNEIAPDTFKVANADGIMFFLLKRLDKKGHHSFIIIADSDNGLELVKYMEKNKGPFDFSMVGEDAYDLYRIEQGIPAAPQEISDLYNPHEAGLRNLISFTKGCYIGQEVIARLDTYDKVQRTLKRIILDDMVESNSDYNLFDEYDMDAGKITSLGYSKKLGKQIGLAYVRKAYTEGGTKLIAKNSNIEPVGVTVQNLQSKK